MLVYRIEHPLTRVGPYSSLRFLSFDEVGEKDYLRLYQVGYNLEYYHRDTKNHPVMLDDLRYKLGYFFNPRNISNLVCGFIGLDQMVEWFDWILDDIFNAGYELFVYSAEDVIIGESNKQCFFDQTKAELVGQYNYRKG